MNQSLEKHAEAISKRAGWLDTLGLFGLVNCGLVMLGINLRFIFTLAVPEVLTAVGKFSAGWSVTGVGILTALLAFGGAKFLAGFARRGYGWAFRVAGALVFLDLVLWALIGNWIEVFAHAFLLYQFYAGARLCGKRDPV